MPVSCCEGVYVSAEGVFPREVAADALQVGPGGGTLNAKLGDYCVVRAINGQEPGSSARRCAVGLKEIDPAAEPSARSKAAPAPSPTMC